MPLDSRGHPILRHVPRGLKGKATPPHPLRRVAKGLQDGPPGVSDAPERTRTPKGLQDLVVDPYPFDGFDILRLGRSRKSSTAIIVCRGRPVLFNNLGLGGYVGSEYGYCMVPSLMKVYAYQPTELDLYSDAKPKHGLEPRDAIRAAFARRLAPEDEITITGTAYELLSIRLHPTDTAWKEELRWFMHEAALKGIVPKDIVVMRTDVRPGPSLPLQRVLDSLHRANYRYVHLLFPFGSESAHVPQKKPKTWKEIRSAIMTEFAASDDERESDDA